MTDFFRPQHEPARLFYDAIVKMAEKRKDVDSDVWIPRERENLWSVARDYAQQHSLRIPTIAEVERAENQAIGHVDYAAKWAYGVCVLLKS